MPEEYVTLAEAARRLNMARDTLRKRLAMLGIVPQPHGSAKFIPAADLELIRASIIQQPKTTTS